MDDVMIIGKSVKLGSYWEDNQVKWSEEKANEQIKSGMTRQRISMEILRSIANSMNDLGFLKFTGEYGEIGQPKPCLDTEIWIGKQSQNIQWYESEHAGTPGEDTNQKAGKWTVLYRFYKKPMAAKIGILQRSAIPEQTKVATAVAEIKRRLKNTSTLLEKEEFEKVIMSYMDELTASGYNQKWKENVLYSAVKGYENVLKKVREGKWCRNRNGFNTEKERRARKLVGRATWFKSYKEKDTQYEQRKKTTEKIGKRTKKRTIDSVMFVPLTPGGALRKQLTQLEERMDFERQIKYVETIGQTQKDVLVRKDPWDGHCNRIDCFPGQSTVGKCTKQGVTYRIACKTCKNESVKSEYIGETSRTGYDRGQEHLKMLENRNPESPLVKHQVETHPDQEPEFEMRILNTHKTPLSRQVEEGMLISNFEGGNLLNCRGEWGQNLPQSKKLPILTWKKVL